MTQNLARGEQGNQEQQLIHSITTTPPTVPFEQRGRIYLRKENNIQITEQEQ